MHDYPPFVPYVTRERNEGLLKEVSILRLENEKSGAVVPGTGENHGEGWNNYGHDFDQPLPAKTSNGADSVIDRHTEEVGAYHE